MLRTCPNIRVLATSREPLRLTSEVLFSVPPLSVPEDDRLLTNQDAHRYESVVLFCERASAFAPWFVLTDGILPKVVSLCRQLDGLPLAVELAAMGMRSMSLDELLARYTNGYQLPTRGSHAIAPRHQTLQAAVNWSYDLCTEHERTLWARLSVFSGGIYLGAAEQACGYAPLSVDEVLPMLSELVDKSIVTFDGAQYRMLETIRHYGLERLSERGEVQLMRRRHCAYVLALAQQGGGCMVQPRAVIRAPGSAAQSRQHPFGARLLPFADERSPNRPEDRCFAVDLLDHRRTTARRTTLAGSAPVR